MSQQQVWQEAGSGKEVFTRHARELSELFATLDIAGLQRAGEAVYEAYRRGDTIYCAGNGGSAATASHFVTDLSWGGRVIDGPRPKALSLAANIPLMSALGNDAGYEEVFVEQMRDVITPGDVLLVISASGNSENVLRAVDFAKEQGATTLGLVGFDGGKLKGKCEVSIHVPTRQGAYELVEDVHHSVCHMLANFVKYSATKDRR